MGLIESAVINIGIGIGMIIGITINIRIRKIIKIRYIIIICKSILCI